MATSLANKILEVIGPNSLTLFEINKRIIDSGYKFSTQRSTNVYVTQAIFHLLHSGVLVRVDGRYMKRKKQKQRR